MTIRPNVHLNGTSREDLLEQNRNALRALKEAKAALQAAAPHGRDYYLQGEAAMQTAMLEHRERMTRVEKTISEITEILISVQDQG